MRRRAAKVFRERLSKDTDPLVLRKPFGVEALTPRPLLGRVRRPGFDGLRIRRESFALVRPSFQLKPAWESAKLAGVQEVKDMHLTDIVKGVEQIVPDMKAATRWEAIDELIDLLVRTGKIKEENRAAVTEAVKKRETSMSTGIGLGIGIPHAATDLITDVVGAFGRSTKGINFDSLDNQPVNLVMLFLVPQGQFQKHLYTLANIAKILHDREFRKRLETAPSADAILEAFRQQRK